MIPALISCQYCFVHCVNERIYTLFVLCQSVTKHRNNNSAHIKIIRAKIAANPAACTEIMCESPMVSTPSLIPNPIGAISERYPARNAKTKKPLNIRTSCGFKKKS